MLKHKLHSQLTIQIWSFRNADLLQIPAWQVLTRQTSFKNYLTIQGPLLPEHLKIQRQRRMEQ